MYSPPHSKASHLHSVQCTWLCHFIIPLFESFFHLLFDFVHKTQFSNLFSSVIPQPHGPTPFAIAPFNPPPILSLSSSPTHHISPANFMEWLLQVIEKQLHFVPLFLPSQTTVALLYILSSYFHQPTHYLLLHAILHTQFNLICMLFIFTIATYGKFSLIYSPKTILIPIEISPTLAASPLNEVM